MTQIHYPGFVFWASSSGEFRFLEDFMRIPHRLVAILLLPLFLVSSPAMAGQVRIADAAARQQAIAAQAAGETAQRAAVSRVLDRDDVRQMASRLGLRLTDASAAVATLSGADLAAAAQHAQAVETALAGGASTIVISMTTLLLLLIIVILLAK